MAFHRRSFLRMGMGAAAGGLLSLAWGEDAPPAGIKLGTTFTDDPTDDDLAFLRHTGVEYVSIWTGIENAHYDFFVRTRERMESNGIRVYNIGIIDLHADPAIVLGLPGAAEKTGRYKQYLRDLGRAGIHYTTYAHMANIKIQRVPGYYKTGDVDGRGGARSRYFDLEAAKKLPLSHGKEYSEDHIWGTFTDFIQEIMPAAEEAGVRVGLHPDDPPVKSLGGVGRCFRNFAAYERAMKIAGSENFGTCFCVGTWAEGGEAMGKDVFEAIHALGSMGKIYKVHFRNVDQPLPRFRETFVDNGYLDMYRVMNALRDVDFDGIIIPDHVPGGGYKHVNTAFTIGYMKALRDRVNDERPPA